MKYRALFLALILTALLALPAAALVLGTANTQVNSAPIAENLNLTTYKGIAITSRFAAVDPDGDNVTFRIVDSPARGEVTLDENDTAAFWYTPYEGKKGKDSFTYVAEDEHGNVSEPATVRIVIEKQQTKVTYSDMTGEAGAYAATRLAEEGIYVGRKVGSLYCFDPGESFTREEFLALAMSAAEVSPLDGVDLTGFHDDGSISVWAKGYVSAAVVEGTVQGSYDGEGRLVFRGSEAISCAEAAVIVDRLLAMGDVKAAPTVSVPAWAAQSAANLEAARLLPAGAEFTGTLSRSEGAMLLTAMLNVMDSRESRDWIW